MKSMLKPVAAGLFVALSAHAQTPPDTSPHKVQLIEVEKGVSLEVLDWG